MTPRSLQDEETLASPITEGPLTVGPVSPAKLARQNASLLKDPVSLDSLSLDSVEKTHPSSGSGRIGTAARGVVRLVEGSTPHLTGETRDLLQRRLLAATGLLFGGFFLFLLRDALFGEKQYEFRNPEHGDFVTKELQWLRVAHIALTAVLGAVVVILYRVRNASLTTLRLAEYAVFGLTAVFFTITTHYRFEVTVWLKDGAHLPVVIVPWLILIFTYALFIPNTWQRSLRFLLPASLLPIAVTLLQQKFCPGYKECTLFHYDANYVTHQALQMAITFTIAVVGVFSINTLRRQAFEAKRLGQYHLKQRIGSGGMGEVYLAEHQMMKRPCAIKVIRPDKAGDPRTLARFQREVRSTAKLSHWNSVDIFDYGSTDDGTFYYVMEYLPGHNVGELVESGGPLPPARVVYLMDQVCRALAEAHQMGLVHRDIKPANLFCAYRGGEFDVAKLLDFGLAKPTVEATEEEDTALTQEGAITGSPLFMSPEQATGEREADVRSDIYSLGCVIYYMLTGKPPFEYSQAVKVIIAHASEDIVPPREHNPDLPAELEQVVLRSLEKDPEDRFQTVGELRRALVEIELEDEWSPDQAADWWSCNGCPERKAIAAAAIEAAAV